MRNRSFTAWLVCLIASCFFFYEFVQMNVFNTISGDLMQDFHINATQLGTLSSFYFIANVIFLFPAGILLDRFSIRVIILTSLSICIVATLLFACTDSLAWATFFRFLTGIGSAFCFLSVIRLATRWFSANRLALVTGVMVTMAMLGGLSAQAPLNLVVKVVGWRATLIWDVVLGAIIFILISFFVRDYPPEYEEVHQHELQQLQSWGYWKSMRLAFVQWQNWMGGIYTCLMNLPVILLGGLWGVLLLTTANGLTRHEASVVTMMLFVGTLIGSSVMGWISDRLHNRRALMMTGSVISLALMIWLIADQTLSFGSLVVLFALMGFVTSTQVMSYPLVAETSVPAITAMSVSAVNITTQGGLAVFEPLFGQLVDLHAKSHGAVTGVQHYAAKDFSWAMIIFPIGFAIAFCAAWMMRERREKVALSTKTYDTPRTDFVGCSSHHYFLSSPQIQL